MAINQFKSRRKAKKMLYSPVTVIVLALIVAVLGRAVWSIYQKYDFSADRLAQAQGQLADLNGREQNLSESIAELSTASGTETVLRTNFRVVKPGESLAVIVNTATTGPATTTPPTVWQRDGQWFKDLY